MNVAQTMNTWPAGGRNLIPAAERDGREPTLSSLQRVLGQDTKLSFRNNFTYAENRTRILPIRQIDADSLSVKICSIRPSAFHFHAPWRTTTHGIFQEAQSFLKGEVIS
jgi:hypothetical protein